MVIFTYFYVKISVDLKKFDVEENIGVFFLWMKILMRFLYCAFFFLLFFKGFESILTTVMIHQVLISILFIFVPIRYILENEKIQGCMRGTTKQMIECNV